MFQPSESSYKLDTKKKIMLTGSMFRETLPLIAAELDASSSSGKDFSAQVIKEVNSVQEGSKPPTTFEDYRHNMLSGAMDLAGSTFMENSETDGTDNKTISTRLMPKGEVEPIQP